MITEFEDFCTWVFVVVDDIWEQIAPFFKRPGPAPVCSDSELIAMTLIGECRGWYQAGWPADRRPGLPRSAQDPGAYAPCHGRPGESQGQVEEHGHKR